jgi:ribokinase
MAGHVIVVGSLNLDLVIRTPHLPAVGETVIGGPFATFPGGKGANQAVAAARLGADVRMIGRVGGDPQGDNLLRSLQASGVGINRVSTDDQAATGVALITVDPEGRNTLVVASGANSRVSPEDISRHAGLFSEASLLIMQLECQGESCASGVEPGSGAPS